MPRPKTIDLTGVDPCSLITPEVRQLVASNHDLPPGTDDAHNGDSRTCMWAGGADGQALQVAAVTTMSAEEVVGNRPSARVEVAGFPAYVRNNTPDVCFISVDTADGQLLDVSDGTHELTEEQNCQKAQQAAEVVMTALTPR